MNKSINRIVFGGILFLSSLPSSNAQVGADDRGIWAYKFIGPADAQLIRRNWKDVSHAVYAQKGSDGHIFDDATLFAGLKHASLCVSEHNEANLKSLATHYPNLVSLTIIQSQPLSKEEESCLRAFVELKLLQISCRAVSPRHCVQKHRTKPGTSGDYQ